MSPAVTCKSSDDYKKYITRIFIASLSIGINQFVDILSEVDPRPLDDCLNDIKGNDRIIKPTDFANTSMESLKSLSASKKNSLLRFLRSMDISMNDALRYMIRSELSGAMTFYLQTRKELDNREKKPKSSSDLSYQENKPARILPGHYGMASVANLSLDLIRRKKGRVTSSDLNFAQSVLARCAS